MIRKNTSELNIIKAQIVDKVFELLADDLYKIILYGSYARGDFTNESDVDVMVILNCSKEKVMNYRKSISRIASRLSLENDIEVSMLIRDRETFETQQSIQPFYKNVISDGVELYG